MRKRAFSLVAFAGLALAFAAPVSAAEGGEVKIMVMKHLCNESIQSEADFQAVEAQGGDNPVASLALTVLNCPTAVNPGDAQTNGVASPATDFAFTVESAAGTKNQPRNSEAAKLCESDVNLDANGNGVVGEEDVCLDISHYVFNGIASGNVTVTESDAPAGYRFGTLRLTPSVIDNNNDADSVLSFADGVIELDTTADEDGMLMLHVYNFETMPDSSTAADVATSPTGGSNVALLAALAVGGALAAAFALQRRTASR